MTNKIGGLSKRLFICKIIKNNNFIGKLSEELCWENCPAIHFGGAHELFKRVTQQVHLGGLSNVLYRRVVLN